MFEKEAEERARKLEEKQTLGVYDNDEDLARDEGFNEGEVVGYEQGFKDGAEYGYNKANEWHILAEEPDVLPKEGQKVKVLTEDNVIQESTYFYDDYFEEMAFFNVGLVKVLAWKEIVLPKEIKENDNRNIKESP